MKSILAVILFVFFFFKQKTAYEIVDCDWSSDVCSSDLEAVEVWRQDLPVVAIAEVIEAKIVDYDSEDVLGRGRVGERECGERHWC